MQSYILFFLNLFLWLSIGCSFKNVKFHHKIFESSAKATELYGWTFEKGSGNLEDSNAVGQEGELYFVPSKKPYLHGEYGDVLNQEANIPIFPKSNILFPHHQDEVIVYDMRLRQLINDVGLNNPFGYIFFNHQYKKFALVGTIAKITSISRFEDGAAKVAIEGLGRFYLQKFVTDSPYFYANVKLFYDSSFTQSEQELFDMQRIIFNRLRYSVKLMKALNPQLNYEIQPSLRPFYPRNFRVRDSRNVKTYNMTGVIGHAQRFSFMVMKMLKIDAATKQYLLQEYVVENRLYTIGKILVNSLIELEKQLQERGIFTPEAMNQFRSTALDDLSDIVGPENPNLWKPDNLDQETGDWFMGPTFM